LEATFAKTVDFPQDLRNLPAGLDGQRNPLKTPTEFKRKILPGLSEGAARPNLLSAEPGLSGSIPIQLLA